MFPQLKTKKFLDVSSGRVVNVIDQFENIAILDDKTRIDVKRLLDKSFYDEYIDPKEFFNQQNYQIFTEKIKSIPDDVLQKMDEGNDSLVMEYDPEEEKRILLEKARNMNPVNSLQNQMEKFKDLIDEDIPVIIPTQTTTQTNPVESYPINQPLVNHTPQIVKEDPMITMFRNAKKNTEVKISFNIEDKIPKPEFIELMEDSYEVSIIEFLSEEFTKKILENPSVIKDKIKSEIENIVYKKKIEKKEKPTPPKTKLLREGESPIKKVRQITNVKGKREIIQEGVDKTPKSTVMNGMPEPKK